MAWVERTFSCDGCGKCTTRMVKTGAGRKWFCYACGETNAVQAARQMAARSGPAWDRWLATQEGRPCDPSA